MKIFPKKRIKKSILVIDLTTFYPTNLKLTNINRCKLLHNIDNNKIKD